MTLHEFGYIQNGSQDGEKPLSGVTLSRDGKTLYGTTSSQWLDYGVIYSLDITTGVETLLYDFSPPSGWLGSITSNNPSALTLSADGKTLYGTDNGRAYALVIGSTNLQVLHSFVGSNTNLSELTLSSDGKTLYGTASGPGDGIVYSLDIASSNLTTLYSFGTNTNDGGQPTGVILSSDGKTLYGATKYGVYVPAPIRGSASRSGGYIFSIDISSKKENIIYSSSSGTVPSKVTLSADEKTLYSIFASSSNLLGTVIGVNISTGEESLRFDFDSIGWQSPDINELINSHIVPEYYNSITPQSLTLSADGKTLYGTCQFVFNNNQSIYGGVFSVNISSGTGNSLYLFSQELKEVIISQFQWHRLMRPGGIIPQSELTISPDGKTFYGTTSAGGGGWGTLYSLKPPKLSQNLTDFTPIGNKTFGDPPFAIKLPTSTSLSGQPVEIYVIGPATRSGNIISITGPGTVVLEAYQAGNDDYNFADVTASFTVNMGSQSIQPFSAIGDQTYGAGPITITLPTSTSLSGQTVVVTVKSGPATISGSTLTLTGVGTVTLAANQAGNSSYNAAPEVITSFGVKYGQSIKPFSAITGKTYGGSPFQITLPTSTSLSRQPVVVSVKSGPAAISGRTITLYGAGTVMLAANQAGNRDYYASPEVTTTFDVGKAAQSIKPFSAITGKTYGGPPFQINLPSCTSKLPVSVTVKSGPATIFGNVITLTGRGTVVLVANQGGNENYKAATEVKTSFAVK